MFRKCEIIASLVLVCCVFAIAAQRPELRIVSDFDPRVVKTVKTPSDTVRVEWVQLALAGSQDLVAEPLEARVFYARTPAGGDISKYKEIGRMLSGANQIIPFASVNKRRIEFTPDDAAIGVGAYYCIVAAVSDADTIYSDYFNLMVDSHTTPTLIYPKMDMLAAMSGQTSVKIDALTPIFRWSRVEGVPYYHIILSDEPLVNENIKPGDVSVIWQAITPNTSIAYGVPDPSGTIAATPPPLTPGKTYSWMALSNYGNHASFTSDRINMVDVMLGQFTIEGTPIKAPRVTNPPRVGAEFNESANKVIPFEWSNIDTAANSYLINLFKATNGRELGAFGLGGVSASMLIWEKTVSRGDMGASGVMRVDFDAAATLTGGDYTLRVYAIDSRGAAATDAGSVSSFKYNTNSGTVNINTIERLGGVGGINLPIGTVELKTEVITGPAQAPLAFFTDNFGSGKRSLPTGMYRITAVKEGYITQSATVIVERDREVEVTFVMTRPEALLYGRVFSLVGSADSAAVNLAKVTATSEWGDALVTLTDGNGSFTFGCVAADWNINVEKAGYRYLSPKKITVRRGDNKNIGAIFIEKNPFALSGVIKNQDGAPIIGAKARILNRDGILIDELSTSQSGAYTFYLAPGSYILTAEKPGLVMFSRNMDVTGSRSGLDITLRDGAALVNGVVIGRTWFPSDAQGGYREVFTPVVSARVKFWEQGARDTLIAVCDATFGRFSISLAKDKIYNARALSTGFGTVAESEFSTSGGATLSFSDTLQALAMIKGVVKDATGAGLGGADVFVYDDSYNVVAFGKSVSNGAYEVRNIPDGRLFTVGAGMSGYFMKSAPHSIDVVGGRPGANRASYDFEMDIGAKTIRWKVDSYSGVGSVKVVSPLNRIIAFGDETDMTAVLNAAGYGDYAVEAVAESNSSLLHLSRNRFSVPNDPSITSIERNIYFPFRHDSVVTRSERYTFEVISYPMASGVTITKMELYYRSEGSAKYDVASKESFAPGDPYAIELASNQIKNGCNLYYYFRVHLSNGDIYGSVKQIFRTYVNPDGKKITRLAVEPEALIEGDTLHLPSSYMAQFSIRAFYSDLFMAFGDNVDVGAVTWSVTDVGSGAVFASADKKPSNAAFTFTTPLDVRRLMLKANLTPSSPYTAASSDVLKVEFPILVSGAALKTVSVRREDNGAGPITNNEEVGFVVDAKDMRDGRVAVSPLWNISPAASGSMVGGVFKPDSNFFGRVNITAEVGRMYAEYIDPERGTGGAPGQDVTFELRHKQAADTISNRKGLKLAFPAGSVVGGDVVAFEVSIPELRNHVHRGGSSGGFRMADSVAYDLECLNYDKITRGVGIIIDIPTHLRGAAKSGDNEFKIAKWYPDSLKWVVIENSKFTSDYSAVTAELSSGTTEKKLYKGGIKLIKSKKGSAKRSIGLASSSTSNVSILGASARYALVTKTSNLSVSMTISPHPFSPYIRPVKEYGSNALEGTCIKVNVDAPQSFVRSIQIHIYNATGKRVWAIDHKNAAVGDENKYWWNGRTSGDGNGRTSVSEEVFGNNEEFNGRMKDRPMCRNGRYFVMAIITDLQGNQKRIMKPVVLMK